jgi:curved DNA-binding protein CbpA
MQNYYEVLGIGKNATAGEIKTAFKKLALKYHPDKNPNNYSAEETFKKINEAYQTLGDVNKKWVYDQKISVAPKQEPFTANPNNFSTQGNATSYNKYSWTAPNTAAGDYSNQGKYYQAPIYAKKERKSDTYIIAFTLLFIIAIASLLFASMMNNITAKQHYEAAVEQYKIQQYQKALVELSRATHFKEDFPEAYEFRGDINIKLDRYYAALADYESAIRFSKSPSEELITKKEMCEKILQ